MVTCYLILHHTLTLLNNTSLLLRSVGWAMGCWAIALRRATGRASATSSLTASRWWSARSLPPRCPAQVRYCYYCCSWVVVVIVVLLLSKLYFISHWFYITMLNNTVFRPTGVWLRLRTARRQWRLHSQRCPVRTNSQCSNNRRSCTHLSMWNDLIHYW